MNLGLTRDKGLPSGEGNRAGNFETARAAPIAGQIHSRVMTTHFVPLIASAGEPKREAANDFAALGRKVRTQNSAPR